MATEIPIEQLVDELTSRIANLTKDNSILVVQTRVQAQKIAELEARLSSSSTDEPMFSEE